MKMVFEHSVKVPAIYKSTAKVLKTFEEERVSLKTAIYEKNNKEDRNNQRILAVTSKIVEKSKVIDYLLETTEILEKEPRLDKWLARVLIYELLWRKNLNSQAKPIQTVLAYQEQLKDALAAYKDDSLSTNCEKVIKPKYVRVNTAKKTVAEVIQIFREEEWILIPPANENNYSEFLKTVDKLTEGYFLIDFHVKDLLIFPSNFLFYKHHLYKNGTLFIQDKASCLVPELLNPPKGSTVLDMCAAPGMKTGHLSNKVGKNGRVYAVERDQKRYLTLCKQVNYYDMKNVRCLHQCALQINENELADVEYILVDPSCSGSGLTTRIGDTIVSESRLKNLAYFQKKLLLHALKFSKVKKVIYSTCSIYPQENEEIIEEIVKTVRNFKLVNLQEVLGSRWNNFGSDKYSVGKSCLYANPKEDLTNGFFIALFERIDIKKQKNIHSRENFKKMGNLEISEKSTTNKRKLTDISEQDTTEENNSVKKIKLVKHKT